MLLELHCHSWNSQGTRIPWEGLDSPNKVVEAAIRMGLGGIAITDHDVITKVKSDKIITIPSSEISSLENGKGHILALGIQEAITPALGIEETIDRIHEQGGIAIAPHPFDVYGKGIRSKAKLCDALEVFNALNIEKMSNWKAGRFAKKHRIPGVSGSDAHCIEMMGYGLNELDDRYATDMESILKSIKNGRVNLVRNYYSIPTLVDWYTLRLRFSYYEILKVLDTKGRIKRITGKQLLKLVRKSPGKIDYLFKGIAYVGLGGAFVYGAVRSIFS